MTQFPVLSLVAFIVAAVLYALDAFEVASGTNVWGHLFVAVGLALGAWSQGPRR